MLSKSLAVVLLLSCLAAVALAFGAALRRLVDAWRESIGRTVR